jgi:hypothetical protein
LFNEITVHLVLMMLLDKMPLDKNGCRQRN